MPTARMMPAGRRKAKQPRTRGWAVERSRLGYLGPLNKAQVHGSRSCRVHFRPRTSLQFWGLTSDLGGPEVDGEVPRGAKKLNSLELAVGLSRARAWST
jgi:hypothetical protein